MSGRRLAAWRRRASQVLPQVRRGQDLLVAYYREKLRAYRENKKERVFARRRRYVNLKELLEEKYWEQKDVRLLCPSRPVLSLTWPFVFCLISRPILELQLISPILFYHC